MRQFAILIWLLALVLPAFSEEQSTSALQGIQVGDLNRSVDPCTDFFEFANGAWRANNPIPSSMTRWSRRWAAGEATKDQLHEILEEASKQASSAAKGSTEQLIGDFYGACMDEEKVNAQGIAPLKPILDQIDAIKDLKDVQRAITSLHHLAIPVPFGFASSPDNHNPSEVIGDFFVSGYAMPDRDYYLKPEKRFAEAREKYKAHVATMFKLSGYDETAAQAASKTVFDMETKLAEASLDNVSLRDPAATDHKTPMDDLQKMTPDWDWNAYLDQARVPPKVDLNVQQPKYMQEVERQLKETPIADWKIYLKWHLINSAADSLSSPLVEEDWKFNSQYLGGAKEMKPRWKRCVESTDVWLGEALGKKYTEKYFPPEAKARMQDLVRNLLAAMKDDLNAITWMGPDTKKKALEKLSTFNVKIGYPDKWKDYSKVPVSRDSLWADVAAGRNFAVDDDWSTIGKPVDRGRWGMTPPTSDAYYNPLLNEIVFPAGILQPPAFSMKATDAVNYGAIGVVIGHEISHGFDDQGAQYDAVGRLQNWWTEADLKQFQQRGACVADQFDHYFIEEGVHHNGKLVLGESIGDLGGAKIAYMAWKKSLEGKPAPPTIDGFTPEQQFFIAWGQFRGDAIRLEQQRLMVQADPHPIAKYRVNGPLSNLPEFQKAFACKDNAPMMRAQGKRCEVW
jgi:endothelin-converting enzyme/putative endopeptidase